MDCVQCGQDSKYKCPNCRQPYCSVTCCKRHKEIPCSPIPSQIQIKKEESKSTEVYTTEDTVPHEKLTLLEKSSELKKCLSNPHVREILEILDTSTLPDVLINDYMREPIFTEFVDACLSVVQSSYNE